MLSLPRLCAAALIPPAATAGSKPPYGAHLCASTSLISLSGPRSSSIRKHRGSRGGRIFSTAAHRENEEPMAVEAELVEDAEMEGLGVEDVDVEEEGEFSFRGGYMGRGEGTDYDKDPEFAEILGSCFDDPEKAQARVEERIRKKRNKILQAKTGSSNPVKVTLNKSSMKNERIFFTRIKDGKSDVFSLYTTAFKGFNFSNSYIWFEFYNAPLANDISLICDAIRSWHIIGRLGGCNSMNMQLSQLPLDHKRPTYDAIQGANVTPTTFYNIGDLEIQDNLARIWVDIGTTEPLLLDVLINALIQISSDYVGIKQVVFGGREWENWKENMSEDAGCSVHKI